MDTVVRLAVRSTNCKCSHTFQDDYDSIQHERRSAAEEGWAKCAEKLRALDDAMVKAWKEEIDTLLVFAGLFSAVVTAFGVEVYSALQPDPGVDLTNQILVQISSQLGSLSLNSSSIHSVQPPFATPSTITSPSARIVRINALWFLALVLSLAAASISIIVKQWLNNFISPLPSNSQEATRGHCLRYDLGLLPWRVPEILSLLPVLLLVALIFLFIGLLILLWGLNDIVAALISAVTAVLFLFFAFTTVSPTIRADCPYKSPQALLTLWLAHGLRHALPTRVLAMALGDLWASLRPVGSRFTSLLHHSGHSNTLPGACSRRSGHTSGYSWYQPWRA